MKKTNLTIEDLKKIFLALIKIYGEAEALHLLEKI